MFAIYLVNYPSALSANVFQTAANKAVLLALVSMGQALVVLTAGIDLSIGMTLVLTNCIGSSIVTGDSLHSALGIAGVLGAGALCGALNGVIIIFCPPQPLVTTVATGAAPHGFALPAPPPSR